MFGTIVNFLAIIVGSIIGMVLKRGISEKISTTIIQGLSLCTVFIGISGAIKGSNFILIIISVALGALIGELVDIDKKIEGLGNTIENKFKGKGSNISQGFVTSSLLFCVGSMAIVGALEGGLSGNYKILFAKSILDGTVSIIFASSLGLGVLLSSFSVLIYQGSITIAASLLKPLLTQSVITDMTAVGSILIMGLGFNMLNMTKIKVANLLPAVFIPIIYQIIMNVIK
ncbi:membrane protein [Clostridium carboxidivorans P7]|uniref:Transport protein n=1 Tax=Clostridium carboxidivorans P7 TaxID=536227 RepID=C6Q093_9CLOT|nr:DUF554 domain-containing protein [Clostridium carboxidivorans]AKN29795.1 membrane protein [Clostridium carboxidivorans P7]EET85075.1 protein of unknown function DUF554 [Clostridium carboxidivorans P7]